MNMYDEEEHDNIKVINRGKYSTTQISYTDGVIQKVWNEIGGQPSKMFENAKLILNDVITQKERMLSSDVDEIIDEHSGDSIEYKNHLWPYISSMVIEEPPPDMYHIDVQNKLKETYRNTGGFDRWGNKAVLDTTSKTPRSWESAYIGKGNNDRTPVKFRNDVHIKETSGHIESLPMFSATLPGDTVGSVNKGCKNLSMTLTNANDHTTKYHHNLSLVTSYERADDISQSTSPRSSRPSSPIRSPSMSNLETAISTAEHFREERFVGSPERVYYEEESRRRLIQTFKVANGNSLWDAMNPERISGRDQFTIHNRSPELVPIILQAVTTALDKIYNSGVNAEACGKHQGRSAVHGGHMNLRPQNILMHSDFTPISKVPSFESAEDTRNRLNRDECRFLSEFMDYEQISRCCRPYVTDPALPNLSHTDSKAPNVRIEITEFDNNNNKNSHLPHFYRLGENFSYPSNATESSNEDLWALANICFTLATGVFICRRSNDANLQSDTWTIEKEVAILPVHERHLWEIIPLPVRDILSSMFRRHITTVEILETPFIKDLSLLISEDRINYNDMTGDAGVERDAAGNTPLEYKEIGQTTYPLLYLQGRTIAVLYDLFTTKKRRMELEAQLPPVAEIKILEAQQTLLQTAKSGDITIMNTVLKKYNRVPKVVDCCDNVGRTPLYIASSRGNLNCVKLLLSNGADPRKSPKQLLNCLAIAIENNHSACLEVLLAHCPPGVPSSSSYHSGIINNGQDIRSHRRSWLVNLPSHATRGWLPLHYAVYYKRIALAKMLLQYGANALLADNAGQIASFYIGKKVETLAATNVSHAFLDEKPMETLLRKQERKMKKLQDKALRKQRKRTRLNQDISLEKPVIDAYTYYDNYKRSILSHFREMQTALAIERAALMALVAREKVDVPVHESVSERVRVAARADDVLLLRRLWDANYDRKGSELLLAPDKGHQMTAVHYAARDNCLGALRFFLGTGLQLHAKDMNGATPLHLAVINGRLECVNFLLNNARQMYPHDPIALSNILNGPYHPNRKDALTPLHYAAEGNFLAIVRALLDAGANSNKLDGTGKLPADRAANNEIRKLLLRPKKNANIPPPPPPIISKYSSPPLPTSKALNMSDLVGLEEEINLDDDISSELSPYDMTDDSYTNDMVNSSGKIIDYNASAKKFIPIQETLGMYESKGVTVDATTATKETTSRSGENGPNLFISIQGVGKDGANSGTSIKSVSELIRDAAMNGRHDELEKWLKLARGTTKTSLASSATKFDNSGHLMSGHHVACIDEIDQRGRTALILAAMRGNIRCVEPLINIGDANVNFSYDGGTTALHLAAERNRPQVIKLLLSRGAIVNAVDAKGNTAFHYACIGNYRECIWTLLQFGCNTSTKNNDGKTAIEATKYSAAKVLVKTIMAKRGW
jgi:ankyrin repeat protein